MADTKKVKKEEPLEHFYKWVFQRIADEIERLVDVATDIDDVLDNILDRLPELKEGKG